MHIEIKTNTRIESSIEFGAKDVRDFGVSDLLEFYDMLSESEQKEFLKSIQE